MPIANFMMFRSIFNGTISRFGLICVLHHQTNPTTSVNRRITDADLGVYPTFWHPQLAAYAKNGWIARLVFESLLIKDQLGNTRHNIPANELVEVCPVDGVSRVRITRCGYGLPLDLATYKDVNRICDAAAGIDPGSYDNSTYLRVDPKYAGYVLTWVKLEGDIHKVFKFRGDPVEPLAVDQPLAFERWGANPRPRIPLG